MEAAVVAYGLNQQKMMKQQQIKEKIRRFRAGRPGDPIERE